MYTLDNRTTTENLIQFLNDSPSAFHATEQAALRLAEAGFPIPAERIIQVGAAIGTHIGPSACGLVYVEK